MKASSGALVTMPSSLADGPVVYVAEHADGVGDCIATVFADDLHAHVSAIAAGRREPDERVTYANGLPKARGRGVLGDVASGCDR